MKNRTWYRIHKWFAITVGVFFLVWTISGIVMILPARLFGPTQFEFPITVGLREARTSPAQAIEVIEQRVGEPVNVVDLNVRQVQDRPVYEIVTLEHGTYLVDIDQGQVLEITAQLAEAIARDKASVQGEVQSIEKLTAHDLYYPFGNLPVYRVVFEGDGSNMYYISAVNGEFSRSNTLTRLRAAISSLHTFEPLTLLVQQNSVRKGLLGLTALVGVMTALTGYLLALLPYLRRRDQNRRSGATVSEQHASLETSPGD